MLLPINSRSLSIENCLKMMKWWTDERFHQRIGKYQMMMRISYPMMMYSPTVFACKKKWINCGINMILSLKKRKKKRYDELLLLFPCHKQPVVCHKAGDPKAKTCFAFQKELSRCQLREHERVSAFDSGDHSQQVPVGMLSCCLTLLPSSCTS